jgi:hypothetical protein
MEEKQSSLGLHTLIYGIGTGLGLIVLTLIWYVTNLYMNQTLQYSAFILLIAGMIIGTMQYRKVQLKGFMTYGQAFSVNFLIGLFASLVSVIFFYFYVKYINTGFIDEMLALTRTKMEAKSGSMTAEQMDQAMSMAERFMSPIWMVIWGFLGYAFWAAVFSLIIGIFLRKKDPNAPTMV